MADVVYTHVESIDEVNKDTKWRLGDNTSYEKTKRMAGLSADGKGVMEDL